MTSQRSATFRRARFGMAATVLAVLVTQPALSQPQENSGQRRISSIPENYPAIVEAAERYAKAVAGTESSAEYHELVDNALRGAMQRSRRGDSREAVPTRVETSANNTRSLETPRKTIFDDAKWQKNMKLILAAPAPAAASSPRIYGGGPVDPGEFPACVAVGRSSGYCCTGTLVGKNIVVTAAHCVDGGCANKVFFGEDSNFPGTGTEITVKAAIPHPQYNSSTFEHDIAVLILDADASSTITPAQVASTADIDAAGILRAVGFGITQTGIFGVKWEVDVAMATSNCNAPADPTTYDCFADRELVAGGNGFDTCNGDSGGPYFLMRGNDALLAGATSRKAGHTNLNCGGGGIAVRVDKYWPWIQATAKSSGGRF